MISETHYKHILKKDVWHELEIKAVLKADSSIYDLLRAAIAAKTLTPICTVQIADDGASVYGFKTTDIIEWAKSKGYQIPDELSSVDLLPQTETVTSVGAGSQSEESNPWLIPNPNDPKPKYSWYVSARYFARQLVKDDSTLLTKRDLLAEKVAKSLTGAGIRKRGGILSLDPVTIKKAFSNITLG